MTILFIILTTVSVIACMQAMGFNPIEEPDED